MPTFPVGNAPQPAPTGAGAGDLATPHQRVVAGRSAPIAVQLYAGEARIDSWTAPTVEVTRADGTVVLPAGTATTKPSGTVGRYARTLTPEEVGDVDLLTATWTVTLDDIVQTRRTTIDVAGGYYFELAELRAMPGLSDTSRYPTEKLAAARTAAEDELERDIGAAFVERYGTLTLAGYGRASVRVRPFVRRLLGGTNRGVALTGAEIAAMQAYRSGLVERYTGVFGSELGYQDVVLRFAHGYSTEAPTDIHDAALELARHHLLGWRSTVSDDPVDAGELGREPVAADAADRRRGQDQIDRAVAYWRSVVRSPVTSVPII